jgi:hypothetical protein
VSDTNFGRAPGFRGQAQDVQIPRGGTWVPGAAVGWRQEEDSCCRVMVRGRALQFMSQPQDVQVHRGGTWVPGAMVGWRQEEDSCCRVMVRVTEGGVEKTAWADLHDVRLPEHQVCPPTQSLPFLPRLPLGRTAEVAQSATRA